MATLIPVPNPMCPLCGSVMYLSFLGADPLRFKVEHPIVPEFVLEMDEPIGFCLNNAKVWKLNPLLNVIEDY